MRGVRDLEGEKGEVELGFELGSGLLEVGLG